MYGGIAGPFPEYNAGPYKTTWEKSCSALVAFRASCPQRVCVGEVPVLEGTSHRCAYLNGRAPAPPTGGAKRTRGGHAWHEALREG